jgi:hypothetical protein
MLKRYSMWMFKRYSMWMFKRYSMWMCVRYTRRRRGLSYDRGVAGA